MDVITYPLLGLKVIHVDKWGPRLFFTTYFGDTYDGQRRLSNAKEYSINTIKQSTRYTVKQKCPMVNGLGCSNATRHHFHVFGTTLGTKHFEVILCSETFSLCIGVKLTTTHVCLDVQRKRKAVEGKDNDRGREWGDRCQIVLFAQGNIRNLVHARGTPPISTAELFFKQLLLYCSTNWGQYCVKQIEFGTTAHLWYW